MCEVKKYHKTSNTQIDKCMRNFIKIFKTNDVVDVLACCCGHGKYPMSVIVKFKVKSDLLRPFELFPEQEKEYKRRAEEDVMRQEKQGPSIFETVKKSQNK